MQVNVLWIFLKQTWTNMNLKWDVKQENLHLHISFVYSVYQLQLRCHWCTNINYGKRLSCCNHGTIEVSVRSRELSKSVSYAPKRINLYEYLPHWWCVDKFQKQEFYMTKLIFITLTFIYKYVYIHNIAKHVLILCKELLYFSIIHIPSIFTYSKH